MTKSEIMLSLERTIAELEKLKQAVEILPEGEDNTDKSTVRTLTLEDIKMAFQDLIRREGSKDEGLAKCREILSHYGVKKMSEIKESDYKAIYDEVAECTIPF